MKRLLIALVFLCFSAPMIATAQIPPPTQPVASTAAPATAAQNTITTTGPVTATTSIETGTIAGQAILWVGSVFGTTIGAALTALIIKLLQNAGVQGTEALRGKLQDMIVNGLNFTAGQAADALKNKGQIEIKNALVAQTVSYVQAHGADTLKKLGVDPNSNQAVEAIKARIETAIADPITPTPAVLDPVVVPKAA